MKVTLLLFGNVAEAAQAERLEAELPTEAVTADALEHLRRQRPGAAPLLDVVALAVNGAYARREAPLRDGDEVAVIPPVSGG